MAHEEIEVHPYADLSPLREALAECGGALRVVQWASIPGTRTVYVEYPEDEYFEQRCRALVDDWRFAGSAEQCHPAIRLDTRAHAFPGSR